MRILFFSTAFPDASSPTKGTYNAALVRALQAHHQVSVISPRFFTEAYSYLGRKKSFERTCDMARIGVTVRYPVSWYTPRVCQNHYGKQMWWSVRNCVERTLKTFRPDAILSYWAHPDGEIGCRAAAIANIPSAVIVGGSDVLVLPHLPGRGEQVKRVLMQSSAVITVSEGLRRKVCELNVPEMNVVTIYQGVDDRIFECTQTRPMARKKLGLDEGQFHLLWVGRMVQIKALPVLIEAAGHLRDRQVPFTLHLVGDGPERAAIRQLVQKMKLDDQVLFHGAVEPEQVAHWYRAADLTVLSSDSEGLPNVLRESLACGTPFVSTDVGSVREVSFREASLLVPPQQSVAFADGIMKMLTTEAKQAAATYLPRTWNNTARKTARLLQSLRGNLSDEPTTTIIKRRVLEDSFEYSEVPNVENPSFPPTEKRNP